MPSPSNAKDTLSKRLRAVGAVRGRMPGARALIAALALLIAALAIAFGFTLRSRQSTKPVITGAGNQAAITSAMKYAQALQAGQFQQALLQVAWVQERLERVRAERPTANAENEVLADLAREAAPNDRSRAVLLDEGIEDAYVFTPRAQIEPAGADAGRGGLERPVSGRAWLRVTYPEPAIAPRDDAGHPIRSLTVGINLSEDQEVLKGEIIGNLEIDRFSIRYF